MHFYFQVSFLYMILLFIYYTPPPWFFTCCFIHNSFTVMWVFTWLIYFHIIFIQYMILRFSPVLWFIIKHIIWYIFDIYLDIWWIYFYVQILNMIHEFLHEIFIYYSCGCFYMIIYFHIWVLYILFIFTHAFYITKWYFIYKMVSLFQIWISCMNNTFFVWPHIVHI